MDLYDMHLFMSLLGFGMGTMLANFQMYYVEPFETCSWGMQARKIQCVLDAWCLICQDPVSRYFSFDLLLLGPGLWCL